jgi:formylglycine-generating enzyme required for sulfatase activity
VLLTVLISKSDRLRLLLALLFLLFTNVTGVDATGAPPRENVLVGRWRMSAIQPGITKRQPGTIFRDCRGCPEMVVIPGGHFTMGSSAEEKSWAVKHGGSAGAVSDEAPQHEVSVPSFALGNYDVTRSELRGVRP